MFDCLPMYTIHDVTKQYLANALLYAALVIVLLLLDCYI